MMPIKIECECGQHYAFDVDPVNGRMPAPVACPACGNDGTGAANERIAQHFQINPSPIIRLVELPPQRDSGAELMGTQPSNSDPVPSSSVVITAAAPSDPAAVASPTMRLAVASNSAPRMPRATAPGRSDPRLGLVDRTQAEHEARAKALWGDTKEQIISYLMVQSFSVPEATELATKLFKERARAVRSNGLRKIVIGVGLMCVPVVALLVFLSIGVIPLKLFAVTIMVGLWGLWLFVNGILIAAAPGSERGDATK